MMGAGGERCPTGPPSPAGFPGPVVDPVDAHARQVAGDTLDGLLIGLGTAFLRYSREYEKQADILGAQLMARARYDARDMASMFKTIEQKSGGGGPESAP